MSWFYQVDSSKYGPVGDSDLVALFRAGRIHANSMVWREGMPEWRAASLVADLPAGCLGSSAPLPPIAMPPVTMAHRIGSSGDAAISMLVPVRVDGFALVAGYLAFLAPLMIVAMLPMAPGPLRVIFSIPGLLAFALGVVALRHLKRDPSARGKVRAWMGVGVPACVLALMAVLFVVSRSGSS